MSRPLSLVVFDVDGTLIDSQVHILASMRAAFEHVDLPVPRPDVLLSIVGLSLPVAMARLHPDGSNTLLTEMVEAYKNAFADLRQSAGQKALAPLFHGARELLDRLGAHDEVLLGLATGKSRRGLIHILDAHELHDRFQTIQVADDHPSKPHPSMILTALDQTGVAPVRAVMIGDTSFDIEMGVAAGVNSVGVSWGHHSDEQLTGAGAHAIAQDFSGLERILVDMMELSW